MRTAAARIAALAWAVGLAACLSTAPPPVSGLDAKPEGGVAAPPSGTVEPGQAPRAPTEPGVCHLTAPKKSDDACAGDAECAPSEPCHAPACVAKGKARPAPPDLKCTMLLACATADANRCGCFEGKCALIPPSDPK